MTIASQWTTGEDRERTRGPRTLAGAALAHANGRHAGHEIADVGPDYLFPNDATRGLVSCSCGKAWGFTREETNR